MDNKNNTIDLEMTAVQLKSLLGIMANVDEDTAAAVDMKYTATLAATLAESLYCAIVDKGVK